MGQINNSDTPLVSFVIPTLNEEECIGATLEDIPTKKLHDQGIPYEVIVVDGASTDSTREVARRKGANVVLEEAHGYGGGYLTGFKYAKGEIIITGDADNTYPFESSLRFIKLLKEENVDFITTNRLLAKNKEAFDEAHLFGNKILSFLLRVLFRLPIRDSQSGMWAFERDLLKKFRFTTKNMNFSTEFKIEGWSKSKHPVELPISYDRRKRGLSKVEWQRHGPQILVFLIKKKLLNLIE